MKVQEKIMMGIDGIIRHGPINIVLLGDSVTHGAVNGYLDYENVYWNRLKKKLNAFRDFVPVNMINSGIGGSMAKDAVADLERRVFRYGPDLVIVCFGLNDVNGTLDTYVASLREIFLGCQERGIDLIFMTPNMLNTYVADDTPTQYLEYAKETARMQSEGRMDAYMTAAVRLAHEMGVAVCDCYAEWKRLAEREDTTVLLANRINHPIPEMHALFANRLYEMIMPCDAIAAESGSTMYRG